MTQQTIGWIGTGVMGKSMANHLLQAGYRLFVYTRTREKADELVRAGAEWCDTPTEIAERADVIFTIVGYPQDVEEIYFGDRGLIANSRPGTVLIDMTTSSPKLAQRIEEAAQAKGLHALDAPVSGGDIGARNAKLAIMIGGAEEPFATVQPILSLLGDNIVLQGAAGAGQHTKMCNQIAIASNMMGVSEAVQYATESGLDPAKVLQSIESGAAGSWSLSNLAPKMIAGNDQPGFYIKHFIKDMKIAIDAAEEMGLDLPGLKLAKSLYEQLANQGLENKGTQTLIEYYRQQTQTQ